MKHDLQCSQRSSLHFKIQSSRRRIYIVYTSEGRYQLSTPTVCHPVLKFPSSEARFIEQRFDGQEDWTVQVTLVQITVVYLAICTANVTTGQSAIRHLPLERSVPLDGLVALLDASKQSKSVGRSVSSCRLSFSILAQSFRRSPRSLVREQVFSRSPAIPSSSPRLQAAPFRLKVCICCHWRLHHEFSYTPRSRRITALPPWQVSFQP